MSIPVERITVDLIERWWKDHGNAVAYCADTKRCLVTVPLNDTYPAFTFAFVPGDGKVEVDAHTQHPHYIEVDRILDEAGMLFDLLRDKADAVIRASECLRVIEEVRKDQ